MVPEHAFGDIDVMVGHTLVILRIDAMHVYQRITHLVITAVDVGIDNAVDTLVTHDVCVDGHPFLVSLARDIGKFLFRPEDNALMSVGIERLHETGTRLHCAVNKDLEPVGFYACGSVFLCISSLVEYFFHIHPTIQFGGQTKYNVQVACLVYLLGSLKYVFVKEIGGVAIYIHRVAL